ncbi:MAG: rod shape-determining protein RodA [Acidobacteria bacterium]|nr:rod shape-determining protein RodA [Acidobacteriota bacterium]
MLLPRPDPWLQVRRLRAVSWQLAGAALALSTVGLVVISSASAELPADYVSRQSLWIALGVVVMLVAALVDYNVLLRYAIWIYVVAVLVLAAVTFFGHEAGGARSWIGIGGLGGQPSDFCKIATVLLLARRLAESQAPVPPRGGLWVTAAICALPVLLIARQPDMGGALMFVPALAAMAVVTGVSLRSALVAFGAALALVAALWVFALPDYQKTRVLSYLQPQADPLGSGYQVRQSRIAVGSGQALGKGYGEGTQSNLRFLPTPHTDFVFAVLAEEYGFAGVTLVMALFLLYLGNGVRIALSARDPAGLLLVVGLLAFLTGYVLYNTAMVVGLLPITGIPLPFLSYGGSFMLFCCAATGLMIGLDLRRFVNV